jgi:hypothetical protein
VDFELTDEQTADPGHRPRVRRRARLPVAVQNDIDHKLDLD